MNIQAALRNHLDSRLRALCILFSPTRESDADLMSFRIFHLAPLLHWARGPQGGKY